MEISHLNLLYYRYIVFIYSYVVGRDWMDRGTWQLHDVSKSPYLDMKPLHEYLMKQRI
jgi:hypothetical protein